MVAVQSIYNPVVQGKVACVDDHVTNRTIGSSYKCVKSDVHSCYIKKLESSRDTNLSAFTHERMSYYHGGASVGRFSSYEYTVTIQVWVRRSMCCTYSAGNTTLESCISSALLHTGAASKGGIHDGGHKVWSLWYQGSGRVACGIGRLATR